MAITKSGETKEAVLDAILDELQQTRITQTKSIEKLRSAVVNHVLVTELIKLDTDGTATREFRVPMGSVSVANHSATGDVTVHAGGPGGGAPGTGPGIGFVKRATFAVLNVTGHVVTLYGTAGQFLTLQVFTVPQPPCTGPA